MLHTNLTLQICADMPCVCRHRPDKAAHCSTDNELVKLELYHVHAAEASYFKWTLVGSRSIRRCSA